MANFEIPDKDAIASVDRAADVLLIYDDSANALKKTTVNTLLDLSSHPLGLTDVQSPTNKTFDNSNTITARDDRFTLQDNADTTKQAVFQLSSITTGTTRTFTLPDVTDILVTESATQGLANKTLQSPTINTPTIVNPTIQTDSIAEFTAANGVTVDGLNIKDGKLNTADSVDSVAYTDGSIDPEHLISGAGTSWVWQSWTPTWTNATIGNGTVTASYTQIGKTVIYRLGFVLGTTSSISGSVVFTLPVTSTSYSGTVGIQNIGLGRILDTGTASYECRVTWNSTTSAVIQVYNAASTYLQSTSLSSSVPMIWATGDEINVRGVYEAA